MSKPCNDCPFVKKTPLNGSPDWLLDVVEKKKRASHAFTHSCHKTDREADGYVGGKKRECVGSIVMQLNEFDQTPGRDGVWASVYEMALAYLDHWRQIGLISGEILGAHLAKGIKNAKANSQAEGAAEIL